MQKFKKVLIIILFVFVGLGLIKNTLIKSVVTVGASSVVGAPVHIDSLAFGILKQAVRIKGFKLYNPSGFPRDVLIDISQISVDYDLAALFKGKLHIPFIVVDLKEMVIIKNKDGKLNVDSLNVAQKKEEPAKEAKGTPQSSKQMPMQIDVATLNLGKVVVKDYTKGEPPSVQAYDIGIKNKTYKDIKSAEQFAALVMVEAMGPTALRGAAIYSAATILGVGFLPAGIIGTLVGKDSGIEEFSVDFEKVYKISLETIQKIGQINKEDRNTGMIKAKVNGADITLEITKKENKKVQVKVFARQYMIPKPEVAQGILYQISEKLK